MATLQQRPPRTGTKLGALATSFVLLVALVVGLTPSEASAGPVISVDLDFTVVTGIEHVESTNRLVITGDDAVEIRDTSGTLLYRLGGIAGAASPTKNKDTTSSSKHLVVVYSRGTNEFVVVDTASGSITSRFDSNVPYVSSIEYIDNTLWFAHHHDDFGLSSGVGKVTVSTETVVPAYWENIVRAYITKLQVSPANTNRVFLAEFGGRRHGYRYDEGVADGVEIESRSDSFRFVLNTSGTAMWVETYDDGIIEINATDLTPTGRSLSVPVDAAPVLLIGESKLVVSSQYGFQTYDTTTGQLLGTSEYSNEVVDIDATPTHMFALTGSSDMYFPLPAILVISGLDNPRLALSPSGVPVGGVQDACPVLTDSITRLYSAYFLRSPDAEGWQFWVDAFSSGVHNMDSMSSFFAESPEFDALYGSLTDYEFVDLVYANVLGRSPEDGGRRYWGSALASGELTRGRMMINFSESEEYVALTGTSVPLSGYFNWYPPGTTFACATANWTLEMPPGIKHFDLLFVNTNDDSRLYRVSSEYDGVFYENFERTIGEWEVALYHAIDVEMDAVMIEAPGDLAWIIVQTPQPMSTARSGW